MPWLCCEFPDPSLLRCWSLAVFQMPDCTGFLQEVDAAIAELGGKVFPKLNWSSPQVTERERREEGWGADRMVCVCAGGGGAD